MHSCTVGMFLIVFMTFKHWSLLLGSPYFDIGPPQRISSQGVCIKHHQTSSNNRDCLYIYMDKMKHSFCKESPANGL